MSTLLLYLALFGVLFALGAPVVLSLAASAVAMLLMKGVDLLVFAQKFMVSMDNYGLTAMLFFILAGEIMNGGGMTRRIVAAVSKLVKGIPGGLAIITLVSCALFAAINGSAIATAIAIGAIMYPAMVKQGYSPAFSAAVIASGGIIGPIIPPSIPMIVYGSTTGDSVAALFMGGFLIGIIMTLGECLVAYLVSKKRGYGVNVPEIEFGNVKGIGWALGLPRPHHGLHRRGHHDSDRDRRHGRCLRLVRGDLRLQGVQAPRPARDDGQGHEELGRCHGHSRRSDRPSPGYSPTTASRSRSPRPWSPRYTAQACSWS